jgi:hypothetical protein
MRRTSRKRNGSFLVLCYFLNSPDKMAWQVLPCLQPLEVKNKIHATYVNHKKLSKEALVNQIIMTKVKKRLPSHLSKQNCRIDDKVS